MENMKTEKLKLAGITNSEVEAENILNEIQEQTNVTIQWESGKFSSTYKRAPIIKLCGEPESVRTAREMILKNLEIQSNTIVLKMDITHEEHPSLIGKKGSLIKQVMQSTDCHIHFPDTNRILNNEKNNMVSITGEPINVEKARVMLRALLPFQVIFEIEKSNFYLVNTVSPVWKELEKLFGLAVHFVQGKDFVSTILRCSQCHFPALRPHILAVIELLSGKRGSDLPPLRVVMDIMPLNQSAVKGLRRSNIQTISKRTGAKIVFPHKNSVPSEQRSVYITGNLDCVYMAWQEVMSSLPMSVMFDINETRETKTEYTDCLLDSNITVNILPKPSCRVKGIKVRGSEKFSHQILQYRQRVLNFPNIEFCPDIEHINKALSFQTNLSALQQSQSVENLCVSLSSTQLENLANFLSATSYFHNVENPFLQTQVPYNSVLLPPVTTSGSNVFFSKPDYERHEGHSTPSSPLTHRSTSLFGRWEENTGDNNNEGEKLHSNLRPVMSEAHGFSTPSSPLTRRSTSLFGSWERNTGDNNNEAVVNESHDIYERPASASETCTNSSDPICLSSPLFKQKGINQHDIFEKRLSAHQAIHRNIESTQVPSSLWAGYGFSRSTPATTATKDSEISNLYSYASLESSNSCSSEETWDNIVLADYIDDKIWSNKEGNNFSMSNVFDFKRHTVLPMNFGSEDILPRLLRQVGLDSLWDVFLKHEIDYTAFLLLNDEDLIELKIGYPARMKITCLIRELQDAKLKMKTFDAAPGAGRKVTKLLH